MKKIELLDEFAKDTMGLFNKKYSKDQILFSANDFARVFKTSALKDLIGYVRWASYMEVERHIVIVNIIHDLNLANDPYPEFCIPRTKKYGKYFNKYKSIWRVE